MKEPKGPLVSFITYVCKMAGVTKNENVEIPILAKFTTAQANSADCLFAFMSVRKQNNRVDVDSDGVLVWVPTFDGPSQRVVPASLRRRILRFCHYPFLGSDTDKPQMYECMQKGLYRLYMAIMFTKLCATAFSAPKILWTANAIGIENYVYPNIFWNTSIATYCAPYRWRNMTTNSHSWRPTTKKADQGDTDCKNEHQHITIGRKLWSSVYSSHQ